MFSFVGLKLMLRHREKEMKIFVPDEFEYPMNLVVVIRLTFNYIFVFSSSQRSRFKR